MNGHSLKVIKKTLAAAARNGYVALSYDKKSKLYSIESKMTIQHMTFDQVSSLAFPMKGNDYV